MTKKDVDKIVSILEKDKSCHLLFAEHTEGLACSLRCTGEDLYSFLTNLIEIQPMFKAVIQAVAMESEYNDDDGVLVN